MIPNTLEFDLDLQDLPVRATQVSSGALSLSAAGTIGYLDTDVLIGAGIISDEGEIFSYCKGFCRTEVYSRTGYYGRYLNIYSADNYDNTLRCACTFDDLY